MTRTFRKATAEDLDRIMQLIEYGRQKMRQSGNTRQWADGYPTRETLSQDIFAGNSLNVLLTLVVSGGLYILLTLFGGRRNAA